MSCLQCIVSSNFNFLIGDYHVHISDDNTTNEAVTSVLNNNSNLEANEALSSSNHNFSRNQCEYIYNKIDICICFSLLPTFIFNNTDMIDVWSIDGYIIELNI